MKKRVLSLVLLCMMIVSLMPVSKAEAAQMPYYITVNLTKNIVTIYGQDQDGNYTVPKKAFICSGGKETPEGTFRTTDKYVWRELFGNVYGQYATRITGHILFHSVPYVKKDKSALEYWEYNKLGDTASAGCIRLTVEDVKWIYDNCPKGTTVKMYRGDVQEPLQPKAVMKINGNDVLRRGWDPTDPDSANPWKKQGGMRELKQESAGKAKVLMTYKEDWNYFLKAEDAEKLFVDLNAEIALAENSALVNSGVGTGWYYGSQYQLPCYQMDGDVYYRLRDVAKMAKASISWDTDKQMIQLCRLQKKVSLTVMA